MQLSTSANVVVAVVVVVSDAGEHNHDEGGSGKVPHDVNGRVR